ncbi:MAG: acylphosphatase [Thermomicrobiales bacterium]
MRRRTRMRISGLVQGVFFRASARDEAQQLGLGGFVRNQPGGSVLIEVEGDDDAVAAFVAWCRHGPPDARVTAVETVDVPVQGDTNFVVSR